MNEKNVFCDKCGCLIIDGACWCDKSSTRKEAGHWWCPSCKEAVIPERVTFQENHDSCGHPVEWIEFQPSPQANQEPYVLAEVLAELSRATTKFPTWPTDPLHAVAVLGEEFGELIQAILQSVYEPTKSTPEDVKKEAVQVAAMALRFLMSLDRYGYRKGEQHEQGGV